MPIAPIPFPPLPLPLPRPRLALVLGSGGVRSVAAIGIVDVLAGAGLRPDLVVGCSSGALFGALIATGMPAADALATAITLWSDELTRQRRWRAYAQLLMPRLAGFDAGFSLRDGGRIAHRIERAFGNLRLEALPTPLRVAATDAASGQAVVLTQGRLADALRASIALPVIFPSVSIDGRRLVDGVVSDPLPVAAADDAGAVIALGFRGAMPRRIDRVSRLVAQVSTAMTNNLMQARLDAAIATGRPLLAIEPDLERRVGLWETAALPCLFEAGRRAAKRQLPQIVALVERSACARAA